MGKNGFEKNIYISASSEASREVDCLFRRLFFAFSNFPTVEPGPWLANLEKYRFLVASFYCTFIKVVFVVFVAWIAGVLTVFEQITIGSGVLLDGSLTAATVLRVVLLTPSRYA